MTDNNGCQSSWVGFIGVSLVSGCTDSTAFNFDPTANVDDSSCVYTGCLDINATNYNPNATISDSSCIYPNYLSLQGVMDFTVPVLVQWKSNSFSCNWKYFRFKCLWNWCC